MPDALLAGVKTGGHGMSDLESKQSAIRFEPVVERAAALPGGTYLFVGVVWPAAVIVIELATRMCAEAFFDPMPTLWHALAVALVPVSNLLLWLRLRQPPGAHGGDVRAADRWLLLASGAAIAVAAFYALIFLPLLPLALIALVVGIGMLPMGPLAGLVAAIGLASRLNARLAPVRAGRLLAGGIAAGLAVLLALDVPAGATRLGLQWASSSDASTRERGIALLRTLGDHDLLLRLCYDTVGRPTGLLSAIVVVGGNGLLEPERRQVVQSTAEVREVYYRVTGKAFNAQPAPFRRAALSDDFAFDVDHGGTEVGGRTKGLDIVSSRMDVSVAGHDAVAYIEWTFELRNTSRIDREARLQIALPPGGVVSRATLWVNGEEKEGAYGGRGEVRAAYQKVAVQQRRDPLLVTTKGADRVLAQAFPVPRNGGTIKFKIGITAPLELIDGGKAQLTLPAIFDRNFSFPSDVGHGVWIESKQSLAAAAKGLTATRVDGGLFRVAGTLADADLAHTRPTIRVARDAGTGPVVAKLGEGEAVVQEIVTEAPPKAGALMLVVDGSARMRKAATELAAALRALPPTARVGLIVAGETLQRIAIAPSSDAHKARLAGLLGAAAFVGGQDNGPALAEALLALESEPDARLLWVHGPQPVAFRRSASQIEQATERLKRLPEVTLYAIEPGPNELLPDRPWGWSARLLPRIVSTEADLAAFLARELGEAPRPILRRASLAADARAGEGMPKGSDHIARLWAKARIDALLRESAHDLARDEGGKRADAVALAVQYRLVTPVSGVVVLETKQQYEESRLTPVSQATVPTIPEPHEWALMLVACLALGWLAWRRRRRLAPAAM
jgi:hypothetical protein